jgi:hypothetical protein
MPMPMVRIRQVRMVVNEGRVAVPMAVGLAARVTWLVFVLVVRVVLVQVVVSKGLVLVGMAMSFTEQQGNSCAHRAHGNDVEPA